MAIKDKHMDKLNAQLKAPRGDNSGNGGSKVATRNPNCAKAKKALNKAKRKADKKAALKKQLEALEEKMETSKKAALKKQLVVLEDNMKADPKAALKKKAAAPRK